MLAETFPIVEKPAVAIPTSESVSGRRMMSALKTSSLDRVPCNGGYAPVKSEAPTGFVQVAGEKQFS